MKNGVSSVWNARSICRMAYRITIIEDNEPDIFLLREGFEQAELECSITALHDGADARDYIDSIQSTVNVPDLILVDMNLPKISGTELLERIRSREILAGVPVVVWSSARSDREVNAMERFDVTLFVTKPLNYFEFIEIAAKLRDILHRRPNAVSRTSAPARGECETGPPEKVQ